MPTKKPAKPAKPAKKAKKKAAKKLTKRATKPRYAPGTIGALGLTKTVETAQQIFPDKNQDQVSQIVEENFTDWVKFSAENIEIRVTAEFKKSFGGRLVIGSSDKILDKEIVGANVYMLGDQLLSLNVLDQDAREILPNGMIIDALSAPGFEPDLDTLVEGEALTPLERYQKIYDRAEIGEAVNVRIRDLDYKAYEEFIFEGKIKWVNEGTVMEFYPKDEPRVRMKDGVQVTDDDGNSIMDKVGFHRFQGWMNADDDPNQRGAEGWCFQLTVTPVEPEENIEIEITVSPHVFGEVWIAHILEGEREKILASDAPLAELKNYFPQDFVFLFAVKSNNVDYSSREYNGTTFMKYNLIGCAPQPTGFDPGTTVVESTAKIIPKPAVTDRITVGRPRVKKPAAKKPAAKKTTKPVKIAKPAKNAVQRKIVGITPEQFLASFGNVKPEIAKQAIPLLDQNKHEFDPKLFEYIIKCQEVLGEPAWSITYAEFCEPDEESGESLWEIGKFDPPTEEMFDQIVETERPE